MKKQQTNGDKMNTELKFKITLGKKDIELTEREARELRRDLNRIFGEPNYSYPISTISSGTGIFGICGSGSGSVGGPASGGSK